MTDLELLSMKLAKMETRFRWLTRIVIVFALVIAAGAVLAQGNRGVRGVGQELEIVTPTPTGAIPRTPVENEVRSRHFVLVDTKGKERASLVADDAGSVFLVMFDA